ncbi:hypothetical protein HDV06_006257 [Boothiomyces sp. JEL0866]|nr:hypothetical protein HDV06_006257 [Boothiomyces sp. JEL0866]
MILALVSLALATPLHKPATVAFGDSWTDDGKGSYVLTNGAWPPSYYYQGRFSNGPVWIEYYSKKTSSALTDFATGGATFDSSLVQGYTGVNGDVPAPAVKDQILKYLPTNKQKVDYFVLAGGNDYFFGISAGVTPSQVVAKAVADVELLLPTAKSVTVLNLPPLAPLPYFGGASTPTAQLFAQYGQWHNGNLTAAFKNERKVRVFDLYTLIQKLINTGDYQLGACVNATTTAICSQPQKHIYWDQFHFTTTIHEKIAEAVEDWKCKLGSSSSVIGSK